MKRAAIAVVMMTASSACDIGAQGGPLAAAPAQTQATRSWRADLKAERAALADADRAFSRATETEGLVDGFTRYFADGAAFLPPRSNVIRGRAAMQEYLRASPLFGTLKWENVRTDVSADGGTGYTLGFGELRTKDGATLWHARLITFWRKQPDGEWKVEANVPIGISVPARPVPAGFGTPQDNGVAGADRRLGQAAAAEAVQQADRDFAALSARTNPGQAFVAFAAPTAVTTGGPEYGPEEIARAFEGGSATIEWGPIAGGAAESGDLGYSIGIATTRAQTPDGPRVSYSKYLTIWQRQADGKWLYVADGGTSRPAPAN
jgi:ketosteroid isomerase-like protein